MPSPAPGGESDGQLGAPHPQGAAGGDDVTFTEGQAGVRRVPQGDAVHSHPCPTLDQFSCPSASPEQAPRSESVIGIRGQNESADLNNGFRALIPVSGADGRIRTDGLLFTKQLLYR